MNEQKYSAYGEGNNKCYPHKRVHYFLSNFNLFYECTSNYLRDNSITSKELLQSLVDIYFQLSQNFNQYKSESKQLNNTITNPTQRLCFKKFQYSIKIYKRFLKSENYNDADIQELINDYEKLKLLLDNLYD